MSLRRAPSEKAQAARTTKAGFTNSEGCMPSGPSMIQRCAPLISGPNWKRQQHERPCRRVDGEREAPHVAQRQERDRRRGSRASGTRNMHLPVDEVERRQAEPLGDGRAAGHQEDEAGHHQGGERREQRAVDRPPPIAEEPSVPRATPWLLSLPSPVRCRARPGRARGNGRRAPRSSDTGRRRRRPATAARPARARRAPRASAAACATALSSVPQRTMRHLLAERRGEFVGSLRRSDRPCSIFGK